MELFTGDIDLEGANGSVQNNNLVTEELTIPVGQGMGGVNTTAFVPYGNIKQVVGRVTQAPGNPGVCTQFDVCINADGNASLGDNIGTALNTTFSSLGDGDGNRSNPWGQNVPVEITVTTNADVDTSDMKIRLVVFYETFNLSIGNFSDYV